MMKRSLRVVFISTLLFATVVTGCGEIGGDQTESALETISPVSSPPAYYMGMDSTLVAEAMHDASQLEALHAIVISRHGKIVAEETFNGSPGLDQAVNVKSVSKSILSAIVGLAIEEGVFEGVDQPVAGYFEEYLSDEDDPRKQDITIDHLLSMRSGLERTSGSNYGRWVSSPNWVRYAITRDLQSTPGSERSYSTGDTHLLSAALTRAAGESTWAFAQRTLAEPLGIRLPQWPTDPQGIYFGGNDMLISPRDLVRFGELYRTGGRYNGEQLLSREWIRESFRPRAASRWSGEGYGYGWFTGQIGDHPTYYGWGYGGQYIYIIPGLEMTIAITSDPYGSGGGGHRRQVRELLAEYIVPAAEHGGSLR